ncbi:plantaricin C family lantibiotic [Streptomyces alkaliterrae]|uniref:Plantaricin C family lantibiotic n=1 Tax=Streptomyces alkaliterrae TaxID=2213162 RepID=A0A5P0YRX5_9ACTN|nr:plantaricin C family lantibiotic [Streptomyces alkaliterrae]MBB1254255.1 plantaricin C family lantibiotic [Streptomyces alkaliterrae]MBB1260794.1 plantaricin C family lantibiotic [Streptomyces alkaliterrae]MQS02630.1 plantaricin C family lantibiotic [Streptomyces alkaliterrae]
MSHEYEGDIALLEEISEQDLDGVAHGAGGVNAFSFSDKLGNDGKWCTLTKECQRSCN